MPSSDSAIPDLGQLTRSRSWIARWSSSSTAARVDPAERSEQAVRGDGKRLQGFPGASSFLLRPEGRRRTRLQLDLADRPEEPRRRVVIP